MEVKKGVLYSNVTVLLSPWRCKCCCITVQLEAELCRGPGGECSYKVIPVAMHDVSGQ